MKASILSVGFICTKRKGSKIEGNDARRKRLGDKGPVISSFGLEKMNNKSIKELKGGIFYSLNLMITLRNLFKN